MCLLINTLKHFYRAMHYIVQSAVLRLHVVRPSVCPSATLVDQEHIGWKSCSISETVQDRIKVTITG